MEIKDFLELCAGNWFSQRTSYHLEQQQAENSKSELTIELLSPDRPEVSQLCQQFRIDPRASLGGTKVSWDNSVDWGKTKQKGYSILVLIPDPENLQIGQLLQSFKTPQKGRYILGNDEALTLIVEGDNIYTEERLWFASPNLRLRTTLIRHSPGFNQTAFYSEIRKIPPKAT
jgi:hypothetical protein